MPLRIGPIACFLALAALAPPVHARVVIGYADTACTHWNDIRTSSAVVDLVREDGMVQWVSGYLTAINAMRIGARQRPYALPSYSALKDMVHARCNAAPTRTFQQVADLLHLELRDVEPLAGSGE